MVARFHYEDVIYQQLLDDQLPRKEQKDVTRHLEECTQCQTKLETLAERGIDWSELRNYLKPTMRPLSKEEANKDSIWIGFLEPSERPDSLGRFGRYEILEVLGRGGTGIVMRGYDPSLDRQSAIKVLSPELAASAAARKRFSREAKSAAAVVHEHVVPIQTVDEEHGIPYLVMPVLEGRSLEERVRQQGPLDVKEVLRIGRQIASGLAAAHAQGLVHRDVKPANILQHTGVERVVITDFGLARTVDDASMTQSGMLVGTPQYMSPEQARGEALDARSDLFSLGSVLYFLCVGHSPFRAETTMGVLSRITGDDPRSLPQQNPDIPDWLDQIIRRLLSKDPEDRYQTAAVVEQLLGKWLAHLQDPTGTPRPSEPPETAAGRGNSRKRNLALAALGGFALAWAGIFVMLETNKGTLTIQSHNDNVAVRITQGEEVAKQLTVKRGDNRVRLAAGQYVVEIEGEHDGLSIENGEVTLTRGDEKLVHIIDSSVKPEPAKERLFRKAGVRPDGTEIGVPVNSANADRAPATDEPNNQGEEDRLDRLADQQGVLTFARELHRPSDAPAPPPGLEKVVGLWHPTTRIKHKTQVDDSLETIRLRMICIEPTQTMWISWQRERHFDNSLQFYWSRIRGRVEIEPTSQEGVFAFSFSGKGYVKGNEPYPGAPTVILRGTIQRIGDKLNLTVTEAENPPDDLGTLPVTWELQGNSETQQLTDDGTVIGVPVNSDRKSDRQPNSISLVSLSPELTLFQGTWKPSEAMRQQNTKLLDLPESTYLNKLTLSGEKAELRFNSKKNQSLYSIILDGEIELDAVSDSGPHPITIRGTISHSPDIWPLENPDCTLRGTLQQNGDSATITITEATNPPTALGPLPQSWELKRDLSMELPSDNSLPLPPGVEELVGSWIPTKEIGVDIQSNNTNDKIRLQSISLDQSKTMSIQWSTAREREDVFTIYATRLDGNFQVTPSHREGEFKFNFSGRHYQGRATPSATDASQVVLHGTFRRSDGQLILTITDADNPPLELGNLPITWELQEAPAAGSPIQQASTSSGDDRRSSNTYRSGDALPLPMQYLQGQWTAVSDMGDELKDFNDPLASVRIVVIGRDIRYQVVDPSQNVVYEAQGELTDQGEINLPWRGFGGPDDLDFTQLKLTFVSINNELTVFAKSDRLKQFRSMKLPAQWIFRKGVLVRDPNAEGNIAVADSGSLIGSFHLFSRKKDQTYYTYSPEAATWHQYQFAPGLEVQSVTKVAGSQESGWFGITGFSLSGAPISELVAIDMNGNFRTYPLPEPITQELPHWSGHGGTLYHFVNHKLYAFSGVTGTWDVLDVPQLEEPTRDGSGEWKLPDYRTGFHPNGWEGIEVVFEDYLQWFTPENGKWVRLPLKSKEDLSGGFSGGPASQMPMIGTPPSADSKPKWIHRDGKFIPIVTPSGSTPPEDFLGELIPSVDAETSEEPRPKASAWWDHIDPRLRELQGTWTAISGISETLLPKDQTDKSLQFILNAQQSTGKLRFQLIKTGQEIEQELSSMVKLLGDKEQKRLQLVLIIDQRATSYLNGSYQIEDDQLTITWDKGFNEKQFVPELPAVWKFRRGAIIPNLDEPNKPLYANPLGYRLALFDFYQVVGEENYYTFSKVDQAWDHHRFPASITSVSPSYNLNQQGGLASQFFGFDQHGDAIESLVAIDTQGKFRESPLEEPFSGSLRMGRVENAPVIYTIAGGRLYAFSGRTGTWDSIAAPNLPEITVSPDRKTSLPTKEDGFDTETIDGIVFQTTTGIHVFSASDGEWKTVDVYPRSSAEVPSPDAQKLAKIQQQLTSETRIQFIKTPLPAVIGYLEQLHGIEIKLDGRALAAAHIGRMTRVDCNIEKATLAVALRRMLEPLKLRHLIRGNELVITTQPDVPRVYFRAEPVAPALAILQGSWQTDGGVLHIGHDQFSLVEHPLSKSPKAVQGWLNFNRDEKQLVFVEEVRQPGSNPFDPFGPTTCRTLLTATLDPDALKQDRLELSEIVTPPGSSLAGRLSKTWTFTKVHEPEHSTPAPTQPPIFGLEATAESIPDGLLLPRVELRNYGNVTLTNLKIHLKLEDQLKIIGGRDPAEAGPDGCVWYFPQVRPNQKATIELVGQLTGDANETTIDITVTADDGVERSIQVKGSLNEDRSDDAPGDLPPYSSILSLLEGTWNSPDGTFTAKGSDYQLTIPSEDTSPKSIRGRLGLTSELDTLMFFEYVTGPGASPFAVTPQRLLFTAKIDRQELSEGRLTISPIKVPEFSTLAGKIPTVLTFERNKTDSGTKPDAPGVTIDASAAGISLFRVRVHNNGNSPVRNVEIEETIDSNLRIVACTDPAKDVNGKVIWTFPSIPPNGEIVLEVQCQATKDITQATNTVKVTADGIAEQTVTIEGRVKEEKPTEDSDKAPPLDGSAVESIK